MENPADDETKKRWEQEAKDKAEREEEAARRPKKRPRAIGYRSNTEGALSDLRPESALADKGGGTTKGKGGQTKSRRAAAGMRTKDRITELTDDEEAIVELD